MIASQATQEATSVVPVNACSVAVVVALVLLCWIVSAWRSRVERDRERFGDVDRLLAAEKRARR